MSEVLLDVSQLVKRFGGLTATDHAELQVERGTIHALIGPNGAGKTTLIHQISGALRPDEGRILFNGTDVTHLPFNQRARRGLVRSYQITSIFRRLTVVDNITLAVRAKNASAYDLWRPARSAKDDYQQAAEIAARVGLGSRLHTASGEMSHGEQRQLELGLALATQPQLLLLDEPMAGMGPEESEGMVELLKGLRPLVTILLVEHDMDAVFRLADRISTLVFGKVIASGSVEQIKNNPDVRRAYLGDEAVN